MERPSPGFGAQALPRLKESASQTAGPYVHIGMTPNFAGIAGVFGEDLGGSAIGADTQGERVRVEGQLIDGTGMALTDAVLETWQADAGGVYHHPADPRWSGERTAFSGWARTTIDPESALWRLDTVKPGRVPMPDGRLQAPHISFWIVARGINLGLHTRLYFGDEAAANAEDPILGRIEHRARVATLVSSVSTAGGMTTHRFYIRLQGEGETVFFDI